LPNQSLPNKQYSPSDKRHAVALDQTRRKKKKLTFSFLGFTFSIILAVFLVGYVIVFVLPPRHLVVKINTVEYTRGDLVELVKVSEANALFMGDKAAVKSGVFNALQTIVENEVISQSAPSYGIYVDQAEVNKQIEYVMRSPDHMNAGKTEEQIDRETRERYLSFLNQLQIDELAHKDLLRKTFLREKMKHWIGESVPYVAEQVHLFRLLLPVTGEYEIMQVKYNDFIKNSDSVESYETAFDLISREFSKDTSDVIRMGGSLGWMPKGAWKDYEVNFYDLEIGELSDPVRNKDDKNSIIFFMVSERQLARELTTSVREQLKTEALQNWVNVERGKHNVFAEFDSEVYAWVHQQVKMADRSPTPTPDPDPFSQIFSGN
jgi:hypothetical protein